MTKIKLAKTPFITLVLGLAITGLAGCCQPSHSLPLPAPTGHSSLNQAQNTHEQTSGSGNFVVEKTSKTIISSAPATPRVAANTPLATSTAPNFPGLPHVPHANYQYHTLSLPSGPLYPLEPFLGRISAPAAWQAEATGHPAPTIAVIDTGFALNHTGLAGRWAINSGEIAGSVTDHDGDGYAGNWRGWDFVHNTAEPQAGQDSPTASSAAHGTRTAGLAGLLNPDAKIMPLQALDDTGSGYTDTVAAAVHYAADHGANIISLSLGSSSDDPYLRSQIDYAISKGAVVIAAAGNNGCNCMLYPAAYPEVLAVGASTPSDTPADFSSYGSNLGVLAPGTGGDLCTTDYSPGNTNAYGCSYAGTSFATPIVAGLAALLAEQCPGCTNVDIITAIKLGADQLLSANNAIRTDTTGYGRIDVARSMALISEPAATPLGQLVSKHNLSLTDISLQTGPQMDSSCVGLPGATCTLTFQGPQGQIIAGGSQTLDYQYGGAIFSWNAATLGLTPGTWKVTTTITANGTTATSLADLITVQP